VPEALDRIVLKALARDLPDRYQSAKELGDELSTFMAQYRFQAGEMQEFMRNLFRVDYQKEAEEVAACGAATLSGAEPEMSIEQLVVSEPSVPTAPTDPHVEKRSRTGSNEPPPPPKSTRSTGPAQAIPGAAGSSTNKTGRTPTVPTQVPQPNPSDPPPDPSAPESGGLWSRLRKKFTR
jgi:hypothetical protein